MYQISRPRLPCARKPTPTLTPCSRPSAARPARVVARTSRSTKLRAGGRADGRVAVSGEAGAHDVGRGARTQWQRVAWLRRGVQQPWWGLQRVAWLRRGVQQPWWGLQPRERVRCERRCATRRSSLEPLAQRQRHDAAERLALRTHGTDHSMHINATPWHVTQPAVALPLPRSLPSRVIPPSHGPAPTPIPAVRSIPPPPLPPAGTRGARGPGPWPPP